ncbi:zinc finger protein CONSTANS-LIKE 6 [Humulus lupulus]|uniref:zinc finger protein CONSTANS-LIKE 6 n=1 Tax=Humulus lupulus TaxID=3486 RepID=UPI002B404081|nr:zinc finger protein CONSTANS-LIKE 6 [Humulus lupulus]
MGYNALILRSPKKEEQQVPDSIVTNDLSEGKDSNLASEEVDILEDLERILGINEEEAHKLTKCSTNVSQLNWEFMEWDEFRNGDEEAEDEEEDISEQKMLFDKDYYYDKNYKCFFEEDEEYLEEEEEEEEEEERYYRRGDVGNVINIKKEQVGFWDDDYNKNASLNLSLNYQEVLDAWSDRGSLWADEYSLSVASNGSNNTYMGEVPVLMEEERRRREASVLRYKEKRQTRLFSKKIRYQVRKLNADKRPRLKGRFVKRV